MSNKFRYRWLTDADYEELCKWWKDWRFPVQPKGILPDNGKCGIMVYTDKMNVCAGFMYFTNSPFVMVEYVVSNFEYKDRDRKTALRALFSAIEEQAKKHGYYMMFSSVKNENLIGVMEDVGWNPGSTHTTEMVKRIKGV